MAFDESISALPIFNEEDNTKIEQSNELDLIIDLPLDEPEEKISNGMNDIFITGNKKNIKVNREPSIKLKVEPIKDKRDVGVSLEKSKTNIDIPKEKKEKYKNIGKRGRDKKPRKKRILSEAQKTKLAEARKKSLEVRRAKAREKYAKKKEKKVEQLEIPKQQQDATILNQTTNFNQFCEFMDRYEARKLKQVSVSQDPHPNKIIPTNQKPRPPIIKREIQKPRYIQQHAQKTTLPKPAAITQPIPIKENPNLRRTPQVIPSIPEPSSMMERFNAIRSNNRGGYGFNNW